MIISDYIRIRKIGTDVNGRILESHTAKDAIMKAAKEFGVLHAGMLIFNDENDTAALMDFILYEYTNKNKRLIEIFLDAHPELTEEESELLDAMLDARFSLYEIQTVSAVNASLQLFDLLKEVQVKVIDTGFSTTGVKGFLIATRLIQISEAEYMTSGVAYVFKPSMRDKIFLEISKAKLRKRNLTSRDLFILFRQLNRIFGENVLLEDARS